MSRSARRAGLRRTLPVAMSFLTTVPAWAGPPFVTDDPDTPDKGHYEINLALESTRNSSGTSGAVPSLEINYGALEHVQTTLELPLAFNNPSGGNISAGLGDVELEVKYRFIDADNYGWRPAVAIAPTIRLRTGDPIRGLGEGQTTVFLPIWLSEEVQRWTIFGGGGYNINPGPENVNFWFVGLGVTYEATPEIILGAELFRTTVDVVGGASSTGFNVGAIYNISDLHHILFAVGRGIENAAASNLLSVYVAWQFTF